MDKIQKPTSKNDSIQKKGGYPAGNKPVATLPSPPKGPGAGSKPAGDSSKS